MDRLAVIGIGYVGLPLVCLAAQRGLRPIAIDIDADKIAALTAGKSHINDQDLKSEVAKTLGLVSASTDYAHIRDANTVIVAVPTPVDSSDRPDLTILTTVCKDVSKHIQPNQLIVIESTIAPGTCDDILIPILEQSSLKCSRDFFVAHCPERIDPGKSAFSTGWNLQTIPRVLGACSPAGLERAKNLYSQLLSAKIHPLSSIKAAEASKVVENSFRDVNIAFVNELAKSCDALGIDVMEVIRGASTKPFAFMPHYPSSGVGGHCIGVDPYYLIEKARGAGFIHRFLNLAREINNDMPRYTVDRLNSALNSIQRSIGGTSITMLGVTYKGNVDDCRESPALRMIKILKNRGAQLTIYDPHVQSLSTVHTLEEALKTQCIIIGADHDEFKAIPPEKYIAAGVKVIIDGKNCLNKSALLAAGIIYKGVGC